MRPSSGCVCGFSSVGQKELDTVHTPSFFLSWLSSSVKVGRREKRVDTVLSQLLVEKVAVLIFIAHASFPSRERIHRDLERRRPPFCLVASVSLSASASVGLFSLRASFQMQALLYRLFVALGGGRPVLCGLPSPQSPGWEAPLRPDIFLFPQRPLSPQWSP